MFLEKSVSVKTCPYCGKTDISIKAPYCHHCGKIFKKKCPDCGGEHDNRGDFCLVLMERLLKEFINRRWQMRLYEKFGFLSGIFGSMLTIALFIFPNTISHFILPLTLIVWVLMFLYLTWYHLFACDEWEKQKESLYLDRISNPSYRKERSE